MSIFKYYVYLLKVKQSTEPFHPPYNPCFTDGAVFYVGKGSGTRMHQHEKDCRARLKRGNKQKLTHKDKTLIQIWDRGLSVEYEVVMRTDDEQEAYRVESELITYYGLERLTNVSYGRRPKPNRGIR